MSALLELIKETPPEDRQAVAELLKPYLQAEPVPETAPEWIGMKEFRKLLPVPKSPTWLQVYLFPKVDWVTNPTPGRGRVIKIDKQKAIAWLDAHAKDVDWNKPLPRG
jgi:hypothetical protein